MPNLYALPVVALSLVGAAAGLSLGRAAIADVNPVYFHDPEQSFHADLAPYRSPDWAAVQAQEYRQAQVVTEPAPTPDTCVGCRTWPVDYVPRRDPTVDRVYAPRADDREYREAVTQVPAEAVDAAPDPARVRIVRYASYPVSREEAAAQEQAATEPAEEDAATQ
jgi:hypothetical protein